MNPNNHWQQHYLAPQQTFWTGREDSLAGERYFQRVQCHDLRTGIPSAQNAYALLGFACDEGIKRNQGHIGAKKGPSEFRREMGNLAYHLPQTVQFFDVGDITCDDDNLEAAQQSLGEVVALLLHNKIHPIVIGGGHEIAWGHYQGINQATGDSTLGIVNIDAHYDLRPLLAGNKGSSGTPFHQIAKEREQRNQEFAYMCIGIQPTANTPSLFEFAKRLHVTTLLAEDIHHFGLEEYLHAIDDFITRYENIYLTICLDAIADAFAPGVSAPHPFGLFPAQVQQLVGHITAHSHVISMDIAELSPPRDINNRTAKLAASLTADYLLTRG